MRELRKRNNVWAQRVPFQKKNSKNLQAQSSQGKGFFFQSFEKNEALYKMLEKTQNSKVPTSPRLCGAGKSQKRDKRRKDSAV